ncbi:MAG: hypothetical protein RIQ56_39 [Candidatus Parcubacteria bacterium]|jgi:hypothetical protein
MYTLLKTSFEVIIRKFPSRTFVQETTLLTALGVYIFTLLLAIPETFFNPDPELQSSTGENLSFLLGSTTIGLLITMFVFRFMLNKYAAQKFTFREVFSFQVVLTSGVSVIGSLPGFASVFVGSAVGSILSIAFFAFALYMLFVYRDAIAEVAAITQQQATNVVVYPILLFLACWVVLMSIAFGVGAFS